MIKIILVDDESLVRDRLKVCLDWEGLGCVVAGEAENGEDAVRLVRDLRPHVAIVDIHMPFINGLVFSQTMKAEYPDTKVVILTGYSDFDYARTALQAGVAHYLLKPINREELRDVMIDLAAQIENESERRSNLAHLEMSYKENGNLLKEKFLLSLLEAGPSMPSGEFAGELNQYAPGFARDGLYAAVVVQIDGMRREEIGQAETALWYFAVSNIFAETLAREFRLESVYDSARQAELLIVDAGAADGADEAPGRLQRLCEEAKDYIVQRLRFTVTVGIGGVKRGIEGIAASHKEASIARRNKLLLGRSRVIAYAALEPRIGQLTMSIDFRQDLLIHLRSGNRTFAREEIRRIFREIGERGLLVDQMQLVLTELFLASAHFAKENGINIAELTGLDFSVAELLDARDSLEDAQAWFDELFRAVLDRYSRVKLHGYARTVERVKTFIDDNYANKDISLETIAANVSMNPSHLSNVFKKESGVAISDYLIRKRMAAAKALMEKGERKLVDIADAVGFSDPYYFSKCFKKMFGVPPSLYLKAK